MASHEFYHAIWFSSSEHGMTETMVFTDTMIEAVTTEELAGLFPEKDHEDGKMVCFRQSEAYDTIEEAKEHKPEPSPFEDYFFYQFKLLPCADGGYPIIYGDDSGNDMCHECATKHLNNNIPSFRPTNWLIYYEGPTRNCDECNKEIESAYGDPNEDDEV